MSDDGEVIMVEGDAEVPESSLDEKASNEEVVTGKLIDELTSIEREIAIMHNVDEDDELHAGESGIPEDVLALDDTGEKLTCETPGDATAAGEEHSDTGKSFERRNGTSALTELGNTPESSTKSPVIGKSSDTQLEHDDLLAVLKGTDEKDASATAAGVTIEGEGEFQIVDIIDNEMETLEDDPLAKDHSPKKMPLTKEEAHKLALEQFESLETQKPKNRRRKQDIKSITQPADLVTSLVSDWSDGDDANSEGKPTEPLPKKKAVTSTAAVKLVQLPKDSASTAPGKEKVTAQPRKVVVSAASTSSSSQPKKLINAQPSQEKKAPELPPPSPFKRTRIIKRKIIWDPDAPETQFSYAKLVKSSAATPTKKDVKKDRSTPVTKKKDDPRSGSESPPATTPAKRQLTDTPSAVNGSKKKKFSEIDRLLGDEGAVNMLNSLEGERTKRSSESKSSVSPPERAPTPQQKKDTPQPKRRTPKPKASASWDYVYKKKPQQTDEDSMIIRRRSNSSYSSSASINRLSSDGPASAGKSQKNTPKSSPKTPAASPLGSTPTSGTKAQDAGKQFEFAKPETKSKAKKLKSPAAVANSLSADMKKVTPKRPAKSPITADDDDEDSEDDEETSDVTVTKIGGVKQLMFSTGSAKLNGTFTVKLMNELSRTLEKLDDDSDCNAVLLLSDGPNFCQGIDFTDLALGPAEKRKNAAVLMGKAVKGFLTTLAKFRKPLIAGVAGSNSGLGVTMLPLFDVVIGSDKGTYETPYAKIGQIPEGYYIFSETPKVRSTFKTKLLWLSEKLHSTESALSGLVNKLTSVTKVNEEALICAKKIASLSSETYSVMKERSIEHSLANIITSLDEEEDILVRQWSSSPCVDNLKHFIHKGQW